MERLPYHKYNQRGLLLNLMDPAVSRVLQVAGKLERGLELCWGNQHRGLAIRHRIIASLSAIACNWAFVSVSGFYRDV